MLFLRVICHQGAQTGLVFCILVHAHLFERATIRLFGSTPLGVTVMSSPESPCGSPKFKPELESQWESPQVEPHILGNTSRDLEGQSRQVTPDVCPPSESAAESVSSPVAKAPVKPLPRSKAKNNLRGSWRTSALVVGAQRAFGFESDDDDAGEEPEELEGFRLRVATVLRSARFDGAIGLVIICNSVIPHCLNIHALWGISPPLH